MFSLQQQIITQGGSWPPLWNIVDISCLIIKTVFNNISICVNLKEISYSCLIFLPPTISNGINTHRRCIILTLSFCVHLAFPEKCLWSPSLRSVGKLIPLVWSSLLEWLCEVLHVLFLEIAYSEIHSKNFAFKKEEVWLNSFIICFHIFLLLAIYCSRMIQYHSWNH